MEEKEVIIQLHGEDRLINVPSDKSIMRAALDAGIKLIHSCLKGQCGSCRAYLVEGEVDMKNNFSLFEEEIQAGQILLCQSYPLTGQVIVNPIRKPKP
jgi:ferredoxin